MLVAGGLVAALMVGAAALSFGLSGNGTAQAETKAPDPIVRTIHRTVRVEKDAKAAQQPVQVVRVASTSAPTMAASPQGGFEDEHEGEFEDEHEGEFEDEHEGGFEDDSQSQDHSSDDGGGEHEDD
jgi:hypothetical protein